MRVSTKHKYIGFLLAVITLSLLPVASASAMMGTSWKYQDATTIIESGNRACQNDPAGTDQRTWLRSGRSAAPAVTHFVTDKGFAENDIRVFKPENVLLCQVSGANHDEFLLVKQSDPSKGLFWDIPKGGGGATETATKFDLDTSGLNSNGGGTPTVSDVPYVTGTTIFDGQPRGYFDVHIYRVDQYGQVLEEIGSLPGQPAIANGAANGSASDDKGLFRSDANLKTGTYRLEVNEPVQGFWAKALDRGLKNAVSFGAWGSWESVLETFQGEDKFLGTASVTITDTTQNPQAVEIHVTREKVSPLAEAMANATMQMSKFIAAGLVWSTTTINQLLYHTKDYVLAGGMEGAWIQIRNLSLTLLVLALLIIAFANVLQVDIEQYGLGRMIPKIVIAIIMAYFSWLVVAFFFDFTAALQGAAQGIIQNKQAALSTLGNISLSNPGAEQIIAALGMFLLAIAILFLVFACLIVLLFSLLLRIVVLSFLIVVAPLAFILNIMPFSSSLYKQWWGEFFKWMFMGPIAVAILAIGAVIASPVSTGSVVSQTLDPNALSASTASEMVIKMLFLAATVYFAATIPQLWGGKIMQGWQKAGKTVGGFLGRATGVPGGVSQVTKSMGDSLTRGRNRRENWFANNLSGGRVGMERTAFRNNQKAALLNARSKAYEFENKEQYTNAYNKASSPLEKQAVLLAGLKKGLIDSDGKTTDGKTMGQTIGALASTDGSGLLEAAAKKDYNTELMENGSTPVASRAAWDMAKKYSDAKSGDLKKLQSYLESPTNSSGGELRAEERGKITGMLGNITESNATKLGETKGKDYSDALNALRSSPTVRQTAATQVSNSPSSPQNNEVSSPGGYRGPGEDD